MTYEWDELKKKVNKIPVQPAAYEIIVALEAVGDKMKSKLDFIEDCIKHLEYDMGDAELPTELATFLNVIESLFNDEKLEFDSLMKYWSLTR